MNPPDNFRPWIKSNPPVLWAFLLLLLLCAIINFGLFALNQQYVTSYFGAQPEDISLANLLTYAGIIATLTLQFRLLQYFERRAYFLVVILTGIGINIANLCVNNLFVFMLFRVLTGIQTAAMAGTILVLMFGILRPPKTLVIGSTVFYGTVLGNTVFIGLLFAWISDNMDWKAVYEFLIVYQVLALLIVLLLLNRDSGMKRYPLYQLDSASFILSLFAMIMLAYTLIYGPKYYWLSDNRILLSATAAVTGFALLFYRQTTKKRPYWHPAVFRVRNFWIGLALLLIYFTVKDSINLIYGYCIGVARWDSFTVMLLGAGNLAGVISCMFIGAWLLVAKKTSFRTLFLVGFATLLTYHVWMIWIFTPDLSFSDLLLPVFLQGAASGFLFAPIVLFMVSSLPPVTGFTGLAMAALTRFSASLLSIAGFYSLQLYFNQLNKESFLVHLTSLDQPLTQRLDQYMGLFRSGGFSPDQSAALATGTLSKTLAVQSQLLTDIQVFKMMAILIAVLILLIIIVPLIGKIYKGSPHPSMAGAPAEP